jgi:hypothetical protein
MGYMSIIHLYKAPEFFTLEGVKGKKICAMEKIHGTSAWIQYSDGKITYHGGSEKGEDFKRLFNEEKLLDSFRKSGYTHVRVHGEAYGGKQQGMKSTYGDTLKFVCFDVRVDFNYFLDLVDAINFVKTLGLDFVPYVIGNCDPEWLQTQAELPSIQAIRNNMGPCRSREGIVVKPLVELKM